MGNDILRATAHDKFGRKNKSKARQDGMVWNLLLNATIMSPNRLMMRAGSVAQPPVAKVIEREDWEFLLELGRLLQREEPFDFARFVQKPFRSATCEWKLSPYRKS